MRPIQELVHMYRQAHNGSHAPIEQAIIAKMEHASNMTDYGTVHFVLTQKGMSDAIMIRALQLYAKTPIFDGDHVVDIIGRDHSDSIKAVAFKVLADRFLLLTLQRLEHQGASPSLQGPLSSAISHCTELCLRGNHTTTLSAFRRHEEAKSSRVPLRVACV
ncbi:Uncharacterised protein [Candidatus Bilamarchaeum dharawalense]|uniref:Uncharacterized protein n=1 Tax=Candidatus Bilamarchaeum dharawalense TaxID=2885759 RepID=A0A5E4LNP9_9ARCH|nr:Uncharacterised protein [Candidatus Bilamarchaeum dharawalense]